VTATRRAVFLDRDGVLNEVLERHGQPASPRSLDQFRMVGDIDAVNRLHAAGYLVFIITNQPDIARGHVSGAQVERMLAEIRRRIHVDDVRVCPHEDGDACACRKPKPGMILDLARHWHVHLRDSWVIGDTWRDMGAAEAAGTHSILLQCPYNAGVAADATVTGLTEAVDRVLSQEEGGGT
jgi:D-glycero-D-manno-heptose 1,7-bisphosphate phosphatase